MTFGERLTAARKKKGLTQDGLGKGLGTDGKDASKAVVLGWEKNRHFPRVDQLAMICERLTVSADYLLFGTKAESDLPQEVLRLASAIEALSADERDLIAKLVAGLNKPSPEPRTPAESVTDEAKRSS